jgi:predicted ATPase
LAVADRLQGDYTDGVVFVDLSPVEPQADVTRAVAEAAGLEGAAADSIGGVADHLAHRPVLLVLDNCEHVLEGSSALVEQMVARGVGAHILATSREPLGVGGEHVWPLGPPHEDGPALFVERALAAEPRVRWDSDDPAVVELCRRLDDVPLALELAAGQLRRFDLPELTKHLDQRFALLSGRSPGGAPRHATMEATIDWSYQLLDGREQSLLRHLSVFPSSFDVPAVESSAPPLHGTAPVTVLGQLVDKSLVVRLPGTGRYRLLETIRVFARDRLVAADEATSAFERHRRYVRDRVTAASRLDRWLSARLAAAFRADLEDARLAFRLSVQQGSVGDAVEIAVGASFLWRNAMGCAEGNTWLDGLEGLVLTPDDALWVANLRADIGQGRGDHRQMFGAATTAAGLVEDAGDPAAACLAAHYGALAYLTDAELAQQTLGTARAFARESGDARLVNVVEVFLAVADLAAGRHDAVRASVTRLDRTASEDGYDRFLLHWTGWMLGLAEQDAVTARRWMSRQQAYLDRTGIVETWITSFSTALCDVLDGDDVYGTLARTLVLADREGYDAAADCLLVLAYAELCAGRADVAAELIGTARHERFNATAHYALYQAVLDRLLREQLSGDALASAMDRGRLRTAGDAMIEYGVVPGAAA